MPSLLDASCGPGKSLTDKNYSLINFQSNFFFLGGGRHLPSSYGPEMYFSFQYLTTVIPYKAEEGGPNTGVLEKLVKSKSLF